MPFSHLAGYIAIIVALVPMAARLRIARSSIIVSAIPFICYWTIRSIFTNDLSTAFSSSLNYTVNWIVIFFIGLISAEYSKKTLVLYVYSLALVVFLGILAAVGIIPGEFFGDKLWSEGMLWGFNHHNDLAAMLLLGFCIAIGLGMRTAPAAILILIGLAISGSRGYYIASIFTGAGLAYMFLRKRKKLMPWVITAVVVFISIIAAIPGTRTRIGKIMHGDLAINARLSSWRITLWSMRENPVFGIGPGQLYARTDYIQRLKDEDRYVDARSGHISHLHNFYLTILAEGGIVAILLLLWFLWNTGYRLATGTYIQKVYFWGFVGFAVGNMFDAQFRGPSAAMDFFLILGLIEAQSISNKSFTSNTDEK